MISKGWFSAGKGGGEGTSGPTNWPGSIPSGIRGDAVGSIPYGIRGRAVSGGRGMERQVGRSLQGGGTYRGYWAGVKGGLVHTRHLFMRGSFYTRIFVPTYQFSLFSVLFALSSIAGCGKAGSRLAWFLALKHLCSSLERSLRLFRNHSAPLCLLSFSSPGKVVFRKGTVLWPRCLSIRGGYRRLCKRASYFLIPYRERPQQNPGRWRGLWRPVSKNHKPQRPTEP